MPLETATYLTELVSSNPAHTDPTSAADSHMRLLKATVKASFPNATAPVNIAPAALNAADGTSLLPGMNFLSTPALGFYKSAPGVVTFTGGVLRGAGAEAGAIMDYAMAAAPSGWLVCDGQAVSRTTYAALFAAIGITWGAGDGSLTFNVPPLQNRFRRHRNDAGLAGVVGTLQAPLNLTHTHVVSGTSDLENATHTHGFGGTTGAMSANASHTHTIASLLAGGIYSNSGNNAGTPWYSGAGNATTAATNTDHTHPFSGNTGAQAANHAHTFTVTSAAAGDASEARPYAASVLTCIKT